MGATVVDQVDRLRAALADRYQLDSEIGRGGMACVYRARDRQHERDVAIKVLRPDLAAALGNERFLREILIEARLQHPHILPLYDSGAADGQLYYVMPLVEGESLRDRIRREKQLPLVDALRISSEIADALSYAHAHGVLHRDIKPANILLSGGHAVVADFGIAKALAGADPESLTGTGIAVGTPEYMSPEQGGGEAHLDGRTDVYALGCVLYEMLTGMPPFTGRTVQTVLARHRHDVPPSIDVVRPGLPSGVTAVVARALAKVPADRFAGADEMARALRLLMESGSHPALEAPARRRGTWRLPVAAALAVLALAGALRVLGPGRPSVDPNKVMVFPLVDRGVAAGSGEAVAIMIGSALEHTEPLKWLDGWSRMNAAQRADLGLLTHQAARELSREKGVGYFIDGAVVQGQDSATVILRLHDVAADSVVTQASASGLPESASLPQIGLRAAVRLLPALVDSGRQSSAGGLATFADRNPAALANWLQGEREYRRSHFVAALRYFGRAVEADSSLAIAALRGAEAATWARHWDDAPPLVELALSRRQFLPQRFVHFADGLRAYFAGDADAAVGAFARAVSADSGWSEAWMGIAETYYHLIPQGDVSDSLAQSAFEAARRADEGFSPPLYHLAELSFRRGELDAARELTRRLLATDPDSNLHIPIRLIERCAMGGARPADGKQAAARNPVEVLQAAKALSAAAAFPECAADGFRAVLAADGSTPVLRWGALMGAQSLLIAQGRATAAGALIDSAVAAGMPEAKGLYVLDAVAGAPMDRQAAAVVAELAGPYPTMSSVRLWYHGIWQAHRGGTESLDSILRALERNAARLGGPADSLLARAMRGYLALARADTAAAIEIFSGTRLQVRPIELPWGMWEPLADVRATLAALLFAKGRTAEAAREAAVFDHPQPVVFLLYLPASLVLRARAGDLLGDARLAAISRRRLEALGRTDLLKLVS